MRAIVLSRRDFREFDQIISLFTKEKGKLELLARGVKKMTSKNSAHLEPFSVIDATILPGKQISHLTRVQPVEYFHEIRTDLDKSLAAGFVVAVTDSLTQAWERDVKLFETLHGWLQFISDFRFQIADYQLLTDGYVVQLLHCLGFTPVLAQCVVCSKTYRDIMSESLNLKSEIKNLKSGLYFAGGGLICSSCRRQKEIIGEEMFSSKGGPASGEDCGLKEVSDMQMLLKGDWRLISEFTLSEEEQKKLHRLVYEYALYHSERRIPDWALPREHIRT